MKHDPGGKLKPNWPKDSIIRARFSKCGKYRYALSEVWDARLPLIMFLMMNPSVASVQHADPTLRKTGEFARRWGYGGQLVGNVHAYRVTKSAQLANASDPVGKFTDKFLLKMARCADNVVLAYGLPPKALRRRAPDVVNLLKGTAPLKYLRLTKNGTPSHPLYLPSNLEPLVFTDKHLESHPR